MADRLQELLQQRALIKEHLEWLDAEIAASSGRAAGPLRLPVEKNPVLRPATVPLVATPAVALPREPDEAEADALLARLAAEEKTPPTPTKTGCWVLFGGLLVLFVAGFGVLLYYFYRE